jgi:hypothetical protein
VPSPSPANRIVLFAAKGGERSAIVRAANALAFAQGVLPAIEEIRLAGAKSYRKIASALNERNIKTRRGGTWSPMQVQRVIRLTDMQSQR